MARASASSLKPCASRKRAIRLCCSCGMVGRIRAAASKSRRSTAVWYLARARARARVRASRVRVWYLARGRARARARVRVRARARVRDSRVRVRA